VSANVELKALDGANPLGFLAALGTMIALNRAGEREAKLHWRVGPTWVPVITRVAVSDPGEFANVPTWRSLGIDLTILHWRGLFAPPGIPAEAVKYWDQTLSKLVKTPTWKKILDKYQWFDAYAGPEEFRKALEEENKVYEQILTQIGLAKPPAKK